MKGLDLIPDEQIEALANRIGDILKAKMLEAWREMLAEACKHSITIEKKNQ